VEHTVGLELFPFYFDCLETNFECRWISWLMCRVWKKRACPENGNSTGEPDYDIYTIIYYNPSTFRCSMVFPAFSDKDSMEQVRILPHIFIRDCQYTIMNFLWFTSWIGTSGNITIYYNIL
jgi:hypothetical protein